MLSGALVLRFPFCPWENEGREANPLAAPFSVALSSLLRPTSTPPCRARSRKLKESIWGGLWPGPADASVALWGGSGACLYRAPALMNVDATGRSVAQDLPKERAGVSRGLTWELAW